jgi:glycosyltransferase involved in cell wall biosynthesis
LPLVVSVIVPARNEEACLGACLQSLIGQTGVSFEILVVDDASTDRTREIAQSFPGVRMVTPPPLMGSWTGKNNAVTAGAKEARGSWLLFTDADTVHLPGSLARALAEAQAKDAALLSYSPEQIVESFWEKAIMPVVFAELAGTYRPSEVSDPASPAAAANGQYLLISREAYDAVGGHAAIASTLLEDVALARNVKQSGRRIFFRFGGDVVRTRMYRNFAQLREGWTKNLAVLFPHPRRLAAVRAGEFLVLLASPILAAASWYHGVYRMSGVGAGIFLATAALFFRRIGRAHFSGGANFLALLGLPLFSWLLLRSTQAYQRKGVTWKGRSYPQQGA